MFLRVRFLAPLRRRCVLIGVYCFDMLEVNWRDLRGQRPVQRRALRARRALCCVFNERFREADALLLCVSGRIPVSDATSARLLPRDRWRRRAGLTSRARFGRIRALAVLPVTVVVRRAPLLAVAEPLPT